MPPGVVGLAHLLMIRRAYDPRRGDERLVVCATPVNPAGKFMSAYSLEW